ncbi:hypothetical protein BDQ12DRAFT_675302 [Crucibulum laeve]|uniref:Phospholipid/glycerol acyltransferase domain-containing protein n=1 Tax=Crucibulum laeve TaxID=68775 RepID=A0A5C3MEH1_9AGAR|nr:hypothetical protein BDQ12DRAFT_675302 [Crucibulum laeve]
MEKFSAYRDPGTGIQPFLTPVPLLGPELLANITLPLRYLVGILRTSLILASLAIYLLVRGLCIVFIPVPILHHAVTHLFTYIIGHTILFLVGLFWIPVESVTRKRGRAPNTAESWNPRAGDVIVSNWVSWIEVVWLAIKFNPIFVLPVCECLPTPPTFSRSSTPITHTPGRRTGTGSANIQSPGRSPAARIPIIGFREVSLLSIIRSTGRTPLADSGSMQSFEEIRKKSSRPLVVFPECTTSNGRGLLRFADVFHQNIPVKSYQVFVMCVRYDPPTSLSPTMTHPIPSNVFNPLAQIFTLTTSLSPLTISIRLLAPSESPGSQLFMANEVISGSSDEDQLSESCAALIAQIGKLKRTGMGWEEKCGFLQFYAGKKKAS